MSSDSATRDFGPKARTFPVSSLMSHLNRTTTGKARKPPINDLGKECPLHEMVQYMCDVRDRGSKKPWVECREVVRLFRRCPGGLTVETTEWEWQRAMEAGQTASTR